MQAIEQAINSRLDAMTIMMNQLMEQAVTNAPHAATAGSGKQHRLYSSSHSLLTSTVAANYGNPIS